MARLASQAFVPSAERKLGLSTVIEYPDVPSVGVVATCTLRPQRALMGVILGVAVHAGHLCIVELGARVAVFTGHGRVQTKQGEASQVVFEEDLLGPRFFVVAAGACPIELTVVNIVSRMTGATVRDGVLPAWSRAMATHTVDPEMTAAQFKASRLAVIEGC